MPSNHHDNPGAPRRVIILGSTGSIGRQTIEVIRSLNAQRVGAGAPEAFEIVGLAAGAGAGAIFEQATHNGVRAVALATESGATSAPTGVECRTGPGAAERLVREVDADLIVAAIVGFAGLDATFAAIERGVNIALANKETLVAAGELVIDAAQRAGVSILPIDSEHSGVWQCLAGSAAPPMTLDANVRRVTITASGGPFRRWTREAIRNATPEQALEHPTWSMGPKVTIDCASLTNKALELIEAHWLFGIGPDRLRAIIHPQSIVHALVEFADGSTVAQLGAPDMRTPIQVALTHPDRAAGISDPTPWDAMASMTFEEPDLDRFPALAVADRVMRAGGVSGAVFNAANEAAVGAFLEGRIPFGAITDLSIGALDAIVGGGNAGRLRGLDDVREADAQGRRFVATELGTIRGGMTIPGKRAGVGGR
ncbi:MAG: 1-deoxy-D-xylulose-5-phosphate reductoisomerase [Phycisphaeraceae bacterium]|nr:1-deoxy-D-xylulose-5-phosphate reductoisomerase [Phycisphaeraceae bacterium]